MFNESLIQFAIDNDREVTFRYAKADEKIIEQRTLQPVEIKEVAGHTMVFGDDEDRGALRSFRLDRIKGEAQLI